MGTLRKSEMNEYFTKKQISRFKDFENKILSRRTLNKEIRQLVLSHKLK